MRPIPPEERLAVLTGNSLFDTIDTPFWNKPEHRDDPALKIKYIHELIRISGFNGDRQVTFAAIDQAHASIANLQQQRDLFRACRADISNLLADLLQPALAAWEILRFVPPATPALRWSLGAERLESFATDFAEMIRPCADWLAQTGPQSAVTSADLGVVVQGHLMYSTSPHDNDLYSALLTTLVSVL